MPRCEPVQLLLKRAAEANLETQVVNLGNPRSGRPDAYVYIDLPNGRRTRKVLVGPRKIERFLGIEFEKFVVLGDYVAIVDTRSGHIEAQVSSGSSRHAQLERMIQEIPGVQIIAVGEPELDQEVFDEEAGTRGPVASNWRLAVEKDGISIEISPASSEFEILLYPGITIKIEGLTTSAHDTALESLERYAAAMLFDIDVVYGRALQLTKRPRENRRHRATLPDRSPNFPRNKYAAQALELYQYGREAGGLPLLEYLAYYQSLEYFFSFFAREQTMNSLRSQLLDPAFDAFSDASLNRLINLTAPAGRNGMGEREQLRATIRACLTEDDVRGFVGSSPEFEDHFCSKKQKIKGVVAMQMKGNQVDLRDQLSDRIYAIRCRIVHSKQDGGGTNADVLLPSSNEVESLQADLEMLRAVAQRALVARAARG